MDGEELYEWIKECLAVFELNWGDKEKMKVSISNGELHIEHNGIRMTRIFKEVG